MGILDNIIGGSSFLQGTQNMFNPQQRRPGNPIMPQQPEQQIQPMFVQPQAVPPQQQQQGQQGQQQGGGPDIGTIMKIMAMFGGA